jgi:hypothetical protein
MLDGCLSLKHHEPLSDMVRQKLPEHLNRTGGIRLGVFPQIDSQIGGWDVGEPVFFPQSPQVLVHRACWKNAHAEAGLNCDTDCGDAVGCHDFCPASTASGEIGIRDVTIWAGLVEEDKGNGICADMSKA